MLVQALISFYAIIIIIKPEEMNIFYPKLIITSLLVFIAITLSYASIYPISIDQRIQQSTQITMGKVVQQYSFWDIERQNIYTAHLLEITAYFKKASNQQYIDCLLYTSPSPRD